ncbi:MAG: aldo/keto reductase, partial [Clostridia bacterium]|nr:aldo/keto reductase [Clostridia bacterium]
MRYIKICGRAVSALALGTDYFGATVSKEDSFSIMDRFLAAGGNAIDTARLYASWLPGGAGASETTIGEWMKSRKNRDQIFLITKGGAVDKGSTECARLSPADLRYDIT